MCELYYYFINFEDISNFINFEDINKFILIKEKYESYYYISKTLYNGIYEAGFMFYLLIFLFWAKGRFHVLFINFSFLGKRQFLCFNACVGTVL